MIWKKGKSVKTEIKTEMLGGLQEETAQPIQAWKTDLKLNMMIMSILFRNTLVHLHLSIWGLV